MSAPDSRADIDGAIRRLLDQQADIRARLAVLVAAQHGLDLPQELDMLRHKLRVLRGLVDHHGMPLPRVLGNTTRPVLTDVWLLRSADRPFATRPCPVPDRGGPRTAVSL